MPARAARAAAHTQPAEPTLATHATLAEPSQIELGRSGTRRAALHFFLHAMGGSLRVAPTALVILGLAGCRALADWSLGVWIRDGTQTSGTVLYSALIAGTVLCGLVQGVLIVNLMLGASSGIHDAVLARVRRALVKSGAKLLHSYTTVYYTTALRDYTLGGRAAVCK